LSVKIKSIDILEVELPFKKEFRHGLGTRRTSGSIFIKAYLENGVIGYGEAMPREYVSGETTKSVDRRLREVLPGKLIGVSFSSFKGGIEFLERFKGLASAARCCIEIALLDALGKHFNKSIATVIGKPVNNPILYSGVISFSSIPSVTKTALEFKAYRFRSVKIKVGSGNDLNRLKVIRRILGDKVDLRVDANCAWSQDEAVEKINKMRRFGISAVEQPVKPHDIRGLKKVTDSVPETIIADESLVTIKDAETLAHLKACDMFNIRLSKCGGILNALKIVDIARRNSIRYQLGCHVGESGVLSAAGRHFACGIIDVEYPEGSYGKFLLEKDVTRKSLSFGWAGKARPISGPGLGINVVDRVLDRYTVNHSVVQ